MNSIIKYTRKPRRIIPFIKCILLLVIAAGCIAFQVSCYSDAGSSKPGSGIFPSPVLTEQ